MRIRAGLLADSSILTFALGGPVLGVKRKSISGDWKSACSHKQPFGVWLAVPGYAAIFRSGLHMIVSLVLALTSWGSFDTASASFRIAALHMSDKPHAPHGLVNKPLA